MRLEMITTIVAALWIPLALAPTPVAHADGLCTGLAGDFQAYDTCRVANHLTCVPGLSIGFAAGAFHHVTCTYPGGGRDECDETFSGPPWNHTLVSVTCNYVPADSTTP